MTSEDVGDEGGTPSAAGRDTPLRPPFISVKTNLIGRDRPTLK